MCQHVAQTSQCMYVYVCMCVSMARRLRPEKEKEKRGVSVRLLTKSQVVVLDQRLQRSGYCAHVTAVSGSGLKPPTIGHAVCACVWEYVCVWGVSDE